MAELINLRTARKQKQRSEKDQLAEANRQQFGRTKAEKNLTKANQSLDAKTLDLHKRDKE